MPHSKKVQGSNLLEEGLGVDWSTIIDKKNVTSMLDKMTRNPS